MAFLDYKHIENEKQENLISIAIEVSFYWNTSIIDKFSLINWIDSVYDDFISDWEEVKENDYNMSEYIQEWFQKAMIIKGIHSKYTNLEKWFHKEKPKMVMID